MLIFPSRKNGGTKKEKEIPPMRGGGEKRKRKREWRKRRAAPANSALLGGLAEEVGCARLTIERFTKFTSPGDSGSPVTASEVDHDDETTGNCHI